MKRILILFCFVTGVCGSSIAMTVSEDFATAVHKDPTAPADWDTGEGVLRLPSTRSKLFENESSYGMIPVNREAGWRFRVAVPGAIIGLGRYLPSSDLDTYTLHLWSDAGVCLSTALVSGTTGWAWTEIEPVQLSTASFYRVSVVVLSGAVFSLPVPDENDYIKFSSACVSSGSDGFPGISTGVITGVPDILFRTNYQTYAEGRSNGYDSGTSRARYLSYSVNHELSSGTINYEFSFSTNSILWFGWQADIGDYVSYRYVRWNATLTSPDPSKTPELSLITINSNSFPEPAVPASPSEGFYINYTTPTLFWNEAYDPDSEDILYRLQLADNSAFVSPLIDSSGIDALSLAAVGLSQKTWFWRLKARDGYSDESEWSETFTFFVDLSLPLQIGDLDAITGSANGEIQLLWMSPSDPPFDNLASYEVFYASFSFTAASIASVDSMPGPSPQSPGNLENLTISGLQNNAEYFFAVRSRDTAGNISPVSNFASALTNASPSVTVISPCEGDTVSGNSDIVWQVSDPNPGDAFHDIRIYLSNDGGITYTLLHELSDVSVDRWTWNSALSGNGAFFRLQISASDSGGLSGTSAETGDFSINNNDNAPTASVKNPQAGNIETGLMLIEWDFEDINFYDRVYFNLFISTGHSAVPQLIEEKLYFGEGLRKGTTSYILDTSLYSDGGDYEISVEVSDGVLVSSAVSGNFSVWNVNHSPLPFSLLSPEDSGEVSMLTPKFVWQGNGDPDLLSGDSVKYRFLVYSSTFPETVLLEVFPVSTNTYAINDTSVLSDFTTYFWRVNAEDSKGGEMMSGETFSFYVKWSQIICGRLSVQSPDLPPNTYIDAAEVSDSLTSLADEAASVSPIMTIPGGSSYKIELKNSLNGIVADASAYTFNLVFDYDGLDVVAPSTTKLFVLDEANGKWTVV
ncbi:MAG: DUF4082 domain-containing protein, partial [Elusimicrobiota bacterium]|nr:DUF4082 domain-containing protein [Elusimicrobiota bacterium]